MKIGLIGFGKAGKAVASVILQSKGFTLNWVLRQRPLQEYKSAAEFLGFEQEVPGTIYSSSHISIKELLDQQPVDFIFDFSSRSSIYWYGRLAGIRGIKIVSAISHYKEEEISLLKELSEITTVFWSPNITLGVNFLMFAAKFLKKISPWSDIEIVEEHFKQKEGVSGTALKIAEALDVERSEINSIRAGGIVGKHEVIFGFPYQTVRLIHESITREAFGNGALFIAHNLKNKSNGLYSFEDILLPYFVAEPAI